MKVYISGPMTNYPNYNKEAFMLAEKYLESLGYEVINPHNLEHKTDNWLDCMKTDIIALLDCEAIYMLDKWIYSKGAKLEFIIAKFLKFKRIK